MATLLRLIWLDQAGPPEACQRVRQLMRRQLTRHRLAAAFPAPAVVAAKSGSRAGVVRVQAGVIEYPGGRGYAAAVFAQARRPWQDDAAINAAIGAAAAAAVSRLRAQDQPVTGLAQALGKAFPELRTDGLRVLDVGFGSTVVESGAGFIVRVARTGAAARGHAVEAAVLPALAPLLPVPIPVPVLRCPPGPQLRFGAIGYRRLPGQPCRAATATGRTARDLGAFLAALHRVDARGLPALPGPDDVWQRWPRLRHDTDVLLRDRLTALERQRLARWWDRFLARAGRPPPGW